ncbi:Ig-like domain-containing protein [Paenibacillus sp. sptzw28]|uniref:Ig-like domain-containing protein n=1 Tax=Paenibacillus sp. sptzw28 TaxID=715179 RepID=UPI001C6F5134|nr:Ig-like domain-containing protein [Paenibacillus sp. sptzw28]QYR22097.1 Ig-like domain-containing protein [Paenibacillus sp. sptzw28]
MFRKKRTISFLLAALLMVQFSIGGISYKPQRVSAASSGPAVLSTSPSAGASNVLTNAKLVLTFDENVVKGSGAAAISIRRISDNELFESYIAASDSHVQIGTTARNVVTITPSKPFAVNTSYYVYIDAGAFVNESNNANYAGMTSTAAWYFTTMQTADTTPPSLTSVAPVNGGTAVIGTTLSLSFNEPVYAANGSISISNINQPGDTRSVAVVSGSVTGSSSNLITVQLGSTLQPSSQYEVTVPSGAFQDASGNSFAGVSANEWRFTTSAPPLGTPTLQPADNGYSVGIGSNLVLTFPVNVAVNTGNIRINRISDNSTFQTISVNSPEVTVNGTVVTVDPPADLAGSTGYYILVDTGAFKDAGNDTILYQGISDASYWNFTTDPGDDNTAPTLAGDRRPLNVQTTPTLDMEMNFSEPVYQGSGNIVVRSLPGGTVFATIPVTSSKVSGGGTAKITIKDSGLVFVNNTSYYVEIGGQAFHDMKGNNFAGISGSGGWQFIVTQDVQKPTVISLTPANNASTVALSGVNLEALFNEPVQLGETPLIKIKRVSDSSNSPVTTKLSIDPHNNRKLLITPESPMAPNTNYYVEMTNGTISDLAGNKYDGILNQYQWTFKTVSSSSGAPVVSNAEVLGTNRIVLTFNSTLDTGSVPVPANFYVTINAAVRPVTDIQISGQTVTLTMQGTIAAGQLIKVSYSAGEKPIKSLAGNAAASFSNRDVSNSPDSTVPRQLSGTVNGNTIILLFNEELGQISPSAYSQFTVYIDGSARSVVQASGSGSVVFITFNGTAVAAAQSVSLSYYASSYSLKDPAGNAVPSFSSFNIRNGDDTKVPVLQTISASAGTITLVYDESLNPAMKPLVSAFTVLVNGTVRAVTSISISGPQVLLTLASPTAASDSVFVSYNGSSPSLSDFSGNAAAPFSSMSANGGTGASAISFNGAVAKAGVVTLTFSTMLSNSYIPSSTQFTVKVNNVSRPVSSVTINGSAVTLNLFTPIAVGDTVTVGYTASGLTLRSSAGVQAASFTDVNAANQTTWSDNASGDFEAAPDGGLAIRKSAATTTAGVSPAGRSANQYILTSEKITSAFKTVRTVGGMVPRVQFTIPETENAGIVAISLGALEDVKKVTPDASFAVAYKDTTYEIPLSTLDYTQLGQVMNAVSAVGQLVVSIDTNANALASSLTSALNAAKAQMMVSPVSYELAVTNGSQTKAIDNLKGYVTRTIKTSGILDPRQTAVVWLDPQTGKPAYVPTHIESSNGQSVITFQRKGNSVYTVVKGSVNFTDVGKHWARNDILLLANKYIAEGSTLTTFAPEKAITRGEFAMFIAKGLGLSGDKQAASRFNDVDTSAAVAAYIGAAANAGIVQGMTDGSFKAASLVTREQMASMMIRAASAAGVQITLTQDASAILKRFNDRGKIGTWAQNDTAKAVQAGIINGMSASTFSGKSNATRAQAAVMVRRLLSYINFLDA